MKAPPTRAEDLVGFKERTLEELRRREPDYAIVLRELKVDRARGRVREVGALGGKRNHPGPALHQRVPVTAGRGFGCRQPPGPRRIVIIS